MRFHDVGPTGATGLAQTALPVLASARGLEIIRLAALGLTNSEIAGRLHISHHTVAQHIAEMLRGCGARSRSGLVARAYAAGLLESWPPRLGINHLEIEGPSGPADRSSGPAHKPKAPPAKRHDRFEPELRLDEPVIVLTCARSGSTLLRFILDAHRGLACPPETSVLDLCARMGTMSTLLDGPPPANGPELSEHARQSIRTWVMTEYTAYLRRAGKTRWCDKSLGSADSATRFLDLFPKARFICLYRHAMDVVDSLIEACPFGLSGYGLEPFVPVHPGNSVAAAADYWTAHAQAIGDFEQAHPGSCLRVRYEDLVAHPQAEADRIFAFLGETTVPSVAAAIFAAERPRFGASDHKIWDTSAIHSASVGRGARVPAGALPVTLVAVMNSVLEWLGYEPVGELWNTVPVGVLADPFVADSAAPQALDPVGTLLATRIANRLAGMTTLAKSYAAVGQAFTVTVTEPGSSGTAIMTRSWRVDLADKSVSQAEAEIPSADDDRWGVIGDVRDWEEVLAGRLSLATAVRSGRVRISAPAGSVMPTLRHDPHLALLGELLITATSQSPRADGSVPDKPGQAHAGRGGRFG